MELPHALVDAESDEKMETWFREVNTPYFLILYVIASLGIVLKSYVWGGV